MGGGFGGQRPNDQQDGAQANTPNGNAEAPGAFAQGEAPDGQGAAGTNGANGQAPPGGEGMVPPDGQMPDQQGGMQGSFGGQRPNGQGGMGGDMGGDMGGFGGPGAQQTQAEAQGSPKEAAATGIALIILLLSCAVIVLFKRKRL
ncbi:hypothetical protein [Paenibacillus sp. LHD-38]|uniref:hypothetical protein n=1 Tax=Paenibacillus sp. LHD-38 TaxID=3072143 RepID=UPI00280F09D8|nr:hypothetical protein [Paenibacillus sp. LHD-38]MDQ8734639.1 hypothetical protein [Paenibacillus sp. LHD-38]